MTIHIAKKGSSLQLYTDLIYAFLSFLILLPFYTVTLLLLMLSTPLLILIIGVSPYKPEGMNFETYGTAVGSGFGGFIDAIVMYIPIMILASLKSFLDFAFYYSARGTGTSILTVSSLFVTYYQIPIRPFVAYAMFLVILFYCRLYAMDPRGKVKASFLLSFYRLTWRSKRVIKVVMAVMNIETCQWISGVPVLGESCLSFSEIDDFGGFGIEKLRVDVEACNMEEMFTKGTSICKWFETVEVSVDECVIKYRGISKTDGIYFTVKKNGDPEKLKVNLINCIKGGILPRFKMEGESIDLGLISVDSFLRIIKICCLIMEGIYPITSTLDCVYEGGAIKCKSMELNELISFANSGCEMFIYRIKNGGFLQRVFKRKFFINDFLAEGNNDKDFFENISIPSEMEGFFESMREIYGGLALSRALYHNRLFWGELRLDIIFFEMRKNSAYIKESCLRAISKGNDEGYPGLKEWRNVRSKFKEYRYHLRCLLGDLEGMKGKGKNEKNMGYLKRLSRMNIRVQEANITYSRKIPENFNGAVKRLIQGVTNNLIRVESEREEIKGLKGKIEENLCKIECLDEAEGDVYLKGLEDKANSEFEYFKEKVKEIGFNEDGESFVEPKKFIVEIEEAFKDRGKEDRFFEDRGALGNPLMKAIKAVVTDKRSSKKLVSNCIYVTDFNSYGDGKNKAFGGKLENEDSINLREMGITLKYYLKKKFEERVKSFMKEKSRMVYVRDNLEHQVEERRNKLSKIKEFVKNYDKEVEDRAKRFEKEAENRFSVLGLYNEERIEKIISRKDIVPRSLKKKTDARERSKRRDEKEEERKEKLRVKELVKKMGKLRKNGGGLDKAPGNGTKCKKPRLKLLSPEEITSLGIKAGSKNRMFDVSVNNGLESGDFPSLHVKLLGIVRSEKTFLKKTIRGKLKEEVLTDFHNIVEKSIKNSPEWSEKEKEFKSLCRDAEKTITEIRRRESEMEYISKEMRSSMLKNTEILKSHIEIIEKCTIF